MVRAALNRLSDGGRIINISSGAGIRPIPALPIYSMAKASINNLTHALAMARGQRATTVNAAVRENADMVKAIEAATALERFGETSNIASVVAFLASDAGRWATGQVIEASGDYKL